MESVDTSLPPCKRTYFIDYMGQLTVHRIYASSMSRWAVAKVKYLRKPLFCALTIDESGITAIKDERVLIDFDSVSNETQTYEDTSSSTSSFSLETAFTHPLASIDFNDNTTSHVDEHIVYCKASFEHIKEAIPPSDFEKQCVAFVADSGNDEFFTLHVFQDSDSVKVKEIGETFKKFISWYEKAYPSNSANLISRNVRLEDLDSIRFEVMLLGKLQYKPDYPQHLNFVDEAVDKYHSLEMEHAVEMEEMKLVEKLSDEAIQNAKAQLSESNDPPKLPPTFIDGSRDAAVEILRRNNTAVWNKDRRFSVEEVRQPRCNSMDASTIAAMKRKSGRTRHCSEPSTTATMGFDKNKTRLLQIGRQSITLISPDQSTRNVEIFFTNISRCTKGVKYKDHFGMFVQDHHGHFTLQNNNGSREEYRFKCYLFKCADGVCDEIMQAMKQACNMCAYGPDPLKTYHHLCKRIHTFSGGTSHLSWIEKGTNLATKCITEAFTEAEQRKVKLKIEECYKAHPPESKYESLVVIMEMIRLVFEEKQLQHDIKLKQLRDPHTPTSMSKKFSLFKNQARKSLNSIESLWGKGKQKMHELQNEAEQHIHSPVEKIRFFSDNARSAPNTPISHQNQSAAADNRSTSSRHRSGSPASIIEGSPLAGSDESKTIMQPEAIRPRCNTVGSTDQGAINVRRKLNMTEKKSASISVLSPVKSSSSSRSQSPDTTSALSRSSSPLIREQTPEKQIPAKKLSFHQRIFNKVATPQRKKCKQCEDSKPSPSLNDCLKPLAPLQTPDQIRKAWKRAINDQMILNKIQKASADHENGYVSASTSEKLSYEESDACCMEMVAVWEELLATDNRDRYKMDQGILKAAVKKGVPRNLRGRVWSLLHEQWKLRQQEDHCSLMTSINLPRVKYEEFLKQLTPHQHAILIDLGRTFPSYPYFSQQLGTGQLALYNLLKAYSLVDGNVGYCQGLSFVAGLLLMHMSTQQESFDMLCHLMITMACRKLYLPDMAALRVAVYQLSRLLHDFHKDLYLHFENNDVTLLLFSTPWFLTMFASILPFGFTARIFDLLFMEGIGALFKAAVCLLSYHKTKILQEDGFENIVNYLKNSLPIMDNAEIKLVLDNIFDLDIGEKLRIYEVEYAVLEDGDLFESEEDDHPVDTTKELEHKLARIDQAYQTVTKYNLELVEQLEAARIQISSLQQGLTDMANIDERRTLELEKLKQENDVLKVQNCAL